MQNTIYRVRENDNYVWDTSLLVWVPAQQGFVKTDTLTVSSDISDRAGRLLGHVTVDNFPATQPISAAALPLPTGASTEATLALVKAKTDNLDVALSTRLKPADTLAAVTTVGAVTSITNPVAVTGPLTDAQMRASAVPISATTLPLPALAATSTKQSDGTQKTQLVDGAGAVISSTGNALDVNLKVPVLGSSLLQAGATVEGNGSTISTLGMASAIFTITWTSTGKAPTVVIEGTEDGSHYLPLTMHQLGTSSIYNGSPTLSGLSGSLAFEAPVANLYNVRARIADAGGASTTVTARAQQVSGFPTTVDATVQAATEYITAHALPGVATPLSLTTDKALRVELSDPNLMGALDALLHEIQSLRFEHSLATGISL